MRGPTTKLTIAVCLLHILPSLAAIDYTKDVLRLTCKTEQQDNGKYFAVCMELIDFGILTAGLGITASTNDDRKKLDILVKKINDDRDFTSRDFIKKRGTETLKSEKGKTGRTHYRIDSQTQGGDFANIHYQVAAKSKAVCVIRFSPQPANPRTPVPATQLDQHFSDGQVKDMVQEGLDVGVLPGNLGQRKTELRWREIQLDDRKFIKKGKTNTAKKNDEVQTKLMAQYGNDIIGRQFEAIRDHGPRMIVITY